MLLGIGMGHKDSLHTLLNCSNKNAKVLGNVDKLSIALEVNGALLAHYVFELYLIITIAQLAYAQG